MVYINTLAFPRAPRISLILYKVSSSPRRPMSSHASRNAVGIATLRETSRAGASQAGHTPISLIHLARLCGCEVERHTDWIYLCQYSITASVLSLSMHVQASFEPRIESCNCTRSQSETNCSVFREDTLPLVLRRVSWLADSTVVCPGQNIISPVRRFRSREAQSPADGTSLNLCVLAHYEWSSALEIDGGSWSYMCIFHRSVGYIDDQKQPRRKTHKAGEACLWYRDVEPGVVPQRFVDNSALIVPIMVTVTCQMQGSIGSWRSTVFFYAPCYPRDGY